MRIENRSLRDGLSGQHLNSVFCGILFDDELGA